MKKILCLAALMALASCSAGFNREWEQALADRAKFEGVTGPWTGTWRSDANGHGGALRCIVSRTSTSGHVDPGDLHRFHYHARFMKFLSATYDVQHRVKQSRDGFTFSGDQSLTGAGGGVYHYEGQGTPRQFRATFRSASDHGVFELRRP